MEEQGMLWEDYKEQGYTVKSLHRGKRGYAKGSVAIKRMTMWWSVAVYKSMDH